MAVISALGAWYFRNKFSSIQESINNPIFFQGETLEHLLNVAANTEYGQKYDFKTIKSYRQFAEKIPLNDYEDLKPFIERTMKGEQSLLWPGEISWFAKSSGTTNDKSKFIPVSLESLENCHFQGGRDILTCYCSNVENTEIFNGKGLIIGGSHKVNSLNENSFYGDLSAVLINNIPQWVNLLKTPDKSVALIEDWEKKLEMMISQTQWENVTNISGVPTWTLVLLNRLIETKKLNNIHELWPNLEVYIHGGVSFEPYRDTFAKLVDNSKMKYLETYNASEGFFGLQTDLTDSSMTLMSNYGIFYEFISLKDLEDKNYEKIIPLESVKPNLPYAMIITTNSGLWRYLIGDVITFTSVFPFEFKITGRTKLFINAFGEELMIDNAEKALAKVCEITNSSIIDYTAAPLFLNEKEKGTHEWLIEFEKEPQNLTEFTHLLDQELKNLNSDYEAKRQKDIALVMPIIKSVPKYTFYRWLSSKGRVGGQNKVPRLSNDRKIIDEILAFI